MTEGATLDRAALNANRFHTATKENIINKHTENGTIRFALN